jgi:hypothetical protein
MKGFLFSLALIFSPQLQANTNPEINLPNHFVIKTTPSEPTYTLYESGKKIASIFSYAPTTLSTYELYDAFGSFLMSADLKKDTDPVQLNFYYNQMLLGHIEETSADQKYNSFYIYAEDGKTRLIKGEFNYWRTNIKFSRVIDRKIFAHMSTDYYCKWCNWTFDMIHPAVYNEIPISSTVMLFSIALQNEGWKTSDRCPSCPPCPANNNSHDDNHLDLKNDALSNNPAFKPNESNIQKMINALDTGFEQENRGVIFNHPSEKAQAYEKYCQDLLISSNTSQEKKQAIIYLYQQKNWDQT